MIVDSDPSGGRKSGPSWKGKQIGQFRLQRMLGSGSMSVVLQAEDTNLGRTVALKFLRKDVRSVTKAEQMEQFIREAKCAAALEHPNIVQIYGFQEHAGRWFLIMEHLEGGSLLGLMDRTGPLNPRKACLFIADAAAGLSEAHAAGIIHRDIKPSNLMLTRTGRCKLADFGLVRPPIEQDDFRLSTAPVGTRHYSAPEVLLQNPASPASDVYSLTATLYAVITGRAPFTNDDVRELIREVTQNAPPDIREIAPHTPPAIVELIRQGLSKEPRQRPSAHEMEGVLRGELASMADGGNGGDATSPSLRGDSIGGIPSSVGSSVLAQASSIPVEHRTNGRGDWTRWIVVAAVLALVAVVIAAVLILNNQASAPVSEQVAMVDLMGQKSKTDDLFDVVRRYDGGQGFQPLIQQATDLQSQASTLVRGRQIDAARKKLIELQDLCAKLKNLQADREQALTRQKAAAAGEKRARSAGSAADKGSPLAGALDISRVAQQHFDEGSFQVAAADWTKALGGFDEASLQAVRAKAAECGRAVDELRRSGAEQAGGAEWPTLNTLISSAQHKLDAGATDEALALYDQATTLVSQVSANIEHSKARAILKQAELDQQIHDLNMRASEQFAQARLNHDIGAAQSAMTLAQKALALRADDSASLKLKADIIAFLSHKPGERFENTFKMAFSYIPSGTFMMGSPINEKGRDEDENQVSVTITHPFHITRTTVTQSQWEAVMGPDYKSPDGAKSDDDQKQFVGPDMPVINVSWNDAVAFCKRLSDKEHRTYRLPTEAEWEYACRAGTTTPFSAGDDLTPAQAQVDFSQPYRGKTPGPTPDRPRRVASFPPNAWGLYDMHGNVAQWCQDWYAPYAIGDATDPAGPDKAPNLESANRVVRGGSWCHPPRTARSASRWNYSPVVKTNYIGFRLVLEAQTPAATDKPTTKEFNP